MTAHFSKETMQVRRHWSNTFFFFFLPRLQLEEFPGPGIKLMSQQGPKMLNLRCHKRTPGVTSLMFGKKKILYLVKMYFKN